MGDIIYSRIKELSPDEFSRMKELLSIFHEEVNKSFDSNLYVDVHIYDSKGKESKRKKYVVNLRLDAPAKRIAAEDFDWDIAKATHKVIDNLNNELKHIMKKDIKRIKLRHTIHKNSKG